MCRTGMELQAVWQELQKEYREACLFLGKEEEEGPVSLGVGAIGEGSTAGATRKLLSRAREKWRLNTFGRSLTLQTREPVKGRAVSGWKERYKLCFVFLLQSQGPHFKLFSPMMAEALTTLLCLPSRACMDRLGEKVGGSRVGRIRERVICSNLPGGRFTERHNAMKQEIASICAYAGVPVECEPYGLFGALKDLHQLQRHQHQQVLRLDLRLEVPPTRVMGGLRPEEQAVALQITVPTLYSGLS